MDAILALSQPAIEELKRIVKDAEARAEDLSEFYDIIYEEVGIDCIGTQVVDPLKREHWLFTCRYGWQGIFTRDQLEIITMMIENFRS